MSKGSTQDDLREGARRSRRELLAGAAAATAGVIGAVVLTRPTTAYAGTDGDVVLGVNSQLATGITGVETQNGNAAFMGYGGPGPGVVGKSDSYAGLVGESATGEAVYAQSGSTFGTNFGITRSGVHGVTDSSADAALWGENLGAVAHGAGQGGNGVYGSTDSTGASGVYGHNAGTGYGVAGRAENGIGMLGDSANGTGVVANSASGTALSVSGKAKFNRSGLVSITAPAKSATVAVSGGLSSSSLVLAVMQNAVGGFWVVSAVPNTSTGKATITLNKAVASGSVKVAWFVVN